MNTTFIVPKNIYRGLGSLENLKNVPGNYAVIVTGKKSTKESGSLEKTIQILTENGIGHTIINDIDADPTIEQVLAGAKVMSEVNPNIIIGLGGCSAIDAAKAMWVYYEYPETDFKKLVQPFSVPTLRNKAKFVAIPTTSGTGTEITGLAVITSGNVKYPVVSHELTPDVAIIDGSLCVSMPQHVTAHTGMDALVHAIEAYTSNIDDPYSHALAKEAIKIIFESLPVVYKNPSDLEHRQRMHDASCMAGMSFTNVWLGIVHSMSHQLGGTFHVPHGMANAILMPNVIRYNSKEVDYTELAKLIGKKTVKQFVEEVEKLRSDVGIPATLAECGISEEDFKKALTVMSKAACADPCTLFNKRAVDVNTVKRIYRYTYNGKKVAF